MTIRNMPPTTQQIADAHHITSNHSAFACTCGAEWDTKEDKIEHNKIVEVARRLYP